MSLSYSWNFLREFGHCCVLLSLLARVEQVRTCEHVSSVSHPVAPFSSYPRYLVTYAGIRFPGAEDIPAGFAALDKVPASVWSQVFFTVLLMEGVNRDDTGLGEFVGDFR